MDIGQACIKNAGRETGQVCVVTEKIDDTFVKIVGPRVKARRCNYSHLEQLPKKLALKKGATEKEAIDALLKAGLIKKEDIREKKAPKEKKEQVKKEEKPKKELTKRISIKKKFAKKKK